MDKNKKNYKLTYVLGILLILNIITISLIIYLLFNYEHKRQQKFISSVKSVQSGEYIKDVDILLNENNGNYTNYLTCNISSVNNIWNFTAPNTQNAMTDLISEATFNVIPNVYKYYDNNNDLRILPGPFKKNSISVFFPHSELNKYSQIRDRLFVFSKAIKKTLNGSDYSNYCSRIYTKISFLSNVGVNATDKNTLLSGIYILQDKKFVDGIITELKQNNPPTPNDLLEINSQFITTLQSISDTYLAISTQQNNDTTVQANRAKFSQFVNDFNKEISDINKITSSKIPVTRSMLLDLRKTVN